MEQYKEQLELQRQTYSSQRDETSDFREVLRKKDKEMNAVLDQIEVHMPLYIVWICYIYTIIRLTHKL